MLFLKVIVSFVGFEMVPQLPVSLDPELDDVVGEIVDVQVDVSFPKWENSCPSRQLSDIIVSSIFM